LRAVLIFAIFCLAVMLPADGIVEIKEDFLGNGEFQTFTNHDLAEDRALCKGDMAYGRSLSFSGSNCSMFSGFEFDGLGSYQVASPEHLLRLSELNNLSAKAAINYRSGSQEEKEGLQHIFSESSNTIFQASGRGKVRELVLSAGPKGRPMDLTSTYHAGIFKINSSARFET
jgi:hypothetical protein